MLEVLKQWLSELGDFAAGNVFPAVIILVIGILAIRIVMKLLNKTLEKLSMEKAGHTLIKSVVRVVLYGLLCLMVAAKLGIDVTGVVALASVLTLAISLSVQNALTNVIGGFTLLYTKPFTTGDFVELVGQSGVVQEVGLTYTKLATADSKIISIPNSAVVAAEIVNYTVSGKRRMEIKVTASYSTPVEQVLEALLLSGDVPTKLEGTEPFAAVSGYGDHGITYILHVWAATSDYWTTLCTVNQRVKEVFDEKGIALTYPHLNVHLEK